MEENEIWKAVVGYEGLYEVSSYGRVRSLARKNTKGGVLRPADDGYGYLCVALCKNGKLKSYRVHRLVATSHIPNPLNLPQVNHKNECKTDNRTENLEWCTAEYNHNYGTHNQRVADAQSIPVFQYTISGEFVAWYPSVMEATRQTGLDSGGIAHCANGKCKTQGGFQWSYASALFLDATEGRFNNTQSKHVFQYDARTGRFVMEWPSVMEVERQTGWSGSNICACCNGKRNHAYGFRWFYEYKGLKIAPVNDGKVAPKRTCPVLFD